MKDEWKTLRIATKPYSLEILESLAEEPKRYTDLTKACKSEKTRAERLKELQKQKIIETTTKKIGERTFIHYKLTLKGERIIHTLDGLNEDL